MLQLSRPQLKQQPSTHLWMSTEKKAIMYSKKWCDTWYTSLYEVLINMKFILHFVFWTNITVAVEEPIEAHANKSWPLRIEIIH